MLQKPVCFSLWLFKFGFYKQKLFHCHQCSVPQELTALGWTGSRDSNIYCFPAPRSLQGHSCCLVPTRMGRGEEYTVSQWALMETALLTRKVFLHFFPQFCHGFSLPEQRVTRPMDIWTCWSFISAGAQLPPSSLSPLTSALSAVVACSVWWLCPRTVLSHIW